FDAMVLHQRQVADIITHDPNVLEFMSAVGAGGPNSASNQGRLIIRLKDRSRRKLSADAVIRELQPKLGRVPGMRVYLQNPPTINVGGRQSKSQYQFALQSSDIATLYASSQDLLGKMQNLPGLQ